VHKKCYYKNHRIITEFTKAHHCTISYASFIQSISVRSVLTVHIHLCKGLPTGHFLHGFSTILFRTCILHVLGI
jgi:hypothetical protein